MISGMISDDDPSARGEFRHDLHDRHDRRGDRADAIERARHRQPGSSRAQPVHHHPRLRQREAHEHAERVERHERAVSPVKQDEGTRRRRAERDDAIREGEPVATRGELPRHEAVVREDAGESRKVGERGVRREHEHRERRILKRVVRERVPKMRWPSMGEHGLVRPSASRR